MFRETFIMTSQFFHMYTVHTENSVTLKTMVRTDNTNSRANAQFTDAVGTNKWKVTCLGQFDDNNVDDVGGNVFFFWGRNM